MLIRDCPFHGPVTRNFALESRVNINSSIIVGSCDGRPSHGAEGFLIRTITEHTKPTIFPINERYTNMLTRILLATLVVALMVTFVTSASAQATKKEAKKETVELKSVSCDPQCGFSVRSHDEKELTDIVITHAKKAHNMDMSANDVKAKMKSGAAGKKAKS